MSNGNFEIYEFLAWKKWVAERGRCQAMTKKRVQCRNPCVGMGTDICGWDDFEEVEFQIGRTDRCRCHQKRESLDETLTRLNAKRK